MKSLLDLEAKNSVKRRGPPGQEPGKAARFPKPGEESGISLERQNYSPSSPMTTSRIPKCIIPSLCRVLPETLKNGDFDNHQRLTIYDPLRSWQLQQTSTASCCHCHPSSPCTTSRHLHCQPRPPREDLRHDHRLLSPSSLLSFLHRASSPTSPSRVDFAYEPNLQTALRTHV